MNAKLFQVYEADLQKLESALPKIMDGCFEYMNSPQMQILFDEVKEILSNVRWGYGPPSEVRRVED